MKIALHAPDRARLRAALRELGGGAASGGLKIRLDAAARGRLRAALAALGGAGAAPKTRGGRP